MDWNELTAFGATKDDGMEISSGRRASAEEDLKGSSEVCEESNYGSSR